MSWTAKDTAELRKAADTLGNDSRTYIIRGGADRISELERALGNVIAASAMLPLQPEPLKHAIEHADKVLYNSETT